MKNIEDNDVPEDELMKKKLSERSFAALDLPGRFPWVRDSSRLVTHSCDSLNFRTRRTTTR